VLTFHANWFYIAVITTGLVGLWGIGLAILKREPTRPFHIAMAVAIGAMLVQVVAGVILWQQGHRPGDGFHVFYGVVIAITFSLAYVYRAQLARRPALSYGLLMLFVMGLGLRAWANVA
jgi:hypothetical protein